MLRATLSFLAGLLLVQQWPTLPPSPWILAGIIAAGLIVWRRYWLCLCFTLGILWAITFAAYRLAHQLPKDLENTEIPVTGYVSDLPDQSDKVTRFNFTMTQTDRVLPAIIRLSWYKPEYPIKAGQYWSLTVKLKRPHGSLNPGAFDYERWLFMENIGATGTVRIRPKPVLLKRASAWLSADVWRQTITDLLTQNLSHNPNLGLIKALTLGDGSTISQNQWEVFRKTGTTHLVVISGSHIGLIAGFIYLLVLKGWVKTGCLRWSPQMVAASIALIAALFYSALAGFSIPTQRAMIMLTTAMFATILQRNHSSLHVLAVALWLVLIVDPLAVLAPGFWLSFLAVALIIFTISARLRPPGLIMSTLKVNWATSVGLSPLLLLFFQQVSLISPIANLVAVPIISFIAVPFSLIATILLPLSTPLAHGLFWLVDKSLQGLMWFLTYMADLPYSTLTHNAPGLWALLFAVPAIILLLAPAGIPARSLSGILLLPLVFTDKRSIEPGRFQVTVLDVGQGLAVTVQTAHHWLVYDTGPKYSSGSDSGQTVLLPFLRQQQVAKIDKVLISHSDNDHIGGAESLLSAVPVAQVISSAPNQLSDYHPVPCLAQQSWLWDDVKFTILSPDHVFASDNDNSCVLRIDSAGGSVLLTGDIEAEAEKQLLLKYGQQLKARVLVAPHHGSKTSSTLGFLQTVAPEVVIIPAGYLNQFGHPHADVVARYQHIKAKILTTANTGAVFLTTRDKKLSVSSFRETDGKYWNAK